MKKYLIIILIVIVLIAGFFLMKKDGGTGIAPLGGDEKATEEKGGPFSGTFKEAIALGVPMKCEDSVDTGEGTAKISGIIQGKQYIGKMEVNGRLGNVLMKDNCMWSWEEGQTNGIKMCLEVTEEGEGFFEGDDIELTTTVRCMPTLVTPGMFNPPANINFLDMDEIGSGNLTEEQLQQLEEMSEQR